MTGSFCWANVGEYWSTMEHLGMMYFYSMFDICNVPSCCSICMFVISGQFRVPVVQYHTCIHNWGSKLLFWNPVCFWGMALVCHLWETVGSKSCAISNAFKVPRVWLSLNSIPFLLKFGETQFSDMYKLVYKFN